MVITVKMCFSIVYACPTTLSLLKIRFIVYGLVLVVSAFRVVNLLRSGIIMGPGVKQSVRIKSSWLRMYQVWSHDREVNRYALWTRSYQPPGKRSGGRADATERVMGV